MFVENFIDSNFIPWLVIISFENLPITMSGKIQTIMLQGLSWMWTKHKCQFHWQNAWIVKEETNELKQTAFCVIMYNV